MKLNILSDLHLSLGALELPRNDADVVILAGDIARPKEAISWASGFAKPVLFVPGNHEYYDGSIEGSTEELRQLCAETNIRLLAGNEFVLEGVRFLGTTLWTDFMLFGDGEKRTAAMQEANSFTHDFRKISIGTAAQNLFTPDASAALFRAQSAWLEAKLSEPHAGLTVVITHHAPSPKSIHPRFSDSLLNACFVSDAEHLIDAARACLWVHGHTHDSFDYLVNGVRVVCNARGYAKNGANENPLFDPNFLVRID